jgi:uncharacterized membrane protein
MTTVQDSIEVARPVRTVYNQWTQFEDFPQFMEGVERVEQIDDTHVHWVAEIAGVRREWDAEILRQEPDRVIAWRSTSGARNDGEVLFDPIGADRTRVTLKLDFEGDDAVEKAGEKLGIVSKRVKGDLERFEEFIEKRQVETGAWRGRVN